MSLSPSTKMAIQALLAVSISELISLSFNFERSYWATLTAMSLISQTRGENFKKSVERVLMTIVGGSVGTVLYFTFPDNPAVTTAVMLFAVFMFIYMTNISYWMTVFSISVFVVFLLALIAQWTIAILEARIYETMIGASVALFVTRYVFPITVDTKSLFGEFCRQMTFYIRGFFFEAWDEQVKKHRLSVEFHRLRKACASVKYDLLFDKNARQKFSQLLTLSELLMHYITSLIEVKQEWELIESTHINTLFSSYLDQLEQELVVLTDSFFATASTGDIVELNCITTNALDETNAIIASDLTLRSRYVAHSYLYFIRKIEQTIVKMFQLSSQ